MQIRSQSKKPEILRAAAKFFLADGYRASSTEKIASEVGILKGSLYYHIRSKDDLLSDVILDALQRAEHNLLKGAALIENAQSIQKRLESHFDYICRNCSGLAALLREAEQLPDSFNEVIGAQIERYEQLLAQALRAGQRHGVVTAGDSAVLARMMIGGCTWWGGIDREPGKRAQIRKGILRLIMPGAMPRETPVPVTMTPWSGSPDSRGRQKTL